ncbi:hypothetical protein BB561_004927 [Smittium simulii]|uniref:MRN complex-interacting protein N-terminal domain-containing protein n=1 Tax=Smittium simulii TaxID=133385 RepID=A0A2T9YDB0_9FUNG|nr:hypothetical protein BB561_004927 [Smittium simulii]
MEATENNANADCLSATDKLTESANACFGHVSAYLSAELAGTSEDLDLLEKINLSAKNNIEGLSTEMLDVVALASKIQQSYNEIEMYLAQTDMVLTQVLRCAASSCRIFQIQQKKKTNKWSCKVCGERQSVIQVYYESTVSAECREMVQKMNMMQGELAKSLQNVEAKAPDIVKHKPVNQNKNTFDISSKKSIWDKYASLREDSDNEIGPGELLCSKRQLAIDTFFKPKRMKYKFDIYDTIDLDKQSTKGNIEDKPPATDAPFNDKILFLGNKSAVVKDSIDKKFSYVKPPDKDIQPVISKADQVGGNQSNIPAFSLDYSSDESMIPPSAKPSATAVFNKSIENNRSKTKKTSDKATKNHNLQLTLEQNVVNIQKHSIWSKYANCSGSSSE